MGHVAAAAAPWFASAALSGNARPAAQSINQSKITGDSKPCVAKWHRLGGSHINPKSFSWGRCCCFESKRAACGTINQSIKDPTVNPNPNTHTYIYISGEPERLTRGHAVASAAAALSETARPAAQQKYIHLCEYESLLGLTLTLTPPRWRPWLSRGVVASRSG